MGGFVYVMSNPSFPHLIKIGKSERDPSIYRRAELETTGVPTPFKVEYYAFVEDQNLVELGAHDALSQFRNSKNREFFSCPIPKAIYEIRLSSGDQLKFEQIFYQSPDELAAQERLELQIRESKIQEDKNTELSKQYERDISSYLRELNKSLQIMYERSRSFVRNDPYDGTLLGYVKSLTEVMNYATLFDLTFGTKKYRNAMEDFPKFDVWSNKILIEYRSVLTPKNRENWGSLHASFVKTKENEIKEISYQIRKIHGIGSKLARLNW